MSLASTDGPDETVPPTSILLGDVPVSPIVFQAIMDAGSDDVLNVLGLLDLDVGPAKARQVMVGLAKSDPLWNPAVAKLEPAYAPVDVAAPSTPAVWTWDDPDLSLLPRNRTHMPRFPIERLGTFWAEWCTVAAQNSNSPVDYTAGTLLATVGALFGNVRWGKSGFDWEHPSILWIGLLGDSAASKSPAMRPVQKLIDIIEDRRREAFDAKRLDLLTQAVVAAAIEKDWERRTAKDGVDQFHETGTFPKNIEHRPKEADAPDTLIHPSLTFHDVTVEAVSDHAVGLPRGMLIWSSELTHWCNSFDRYHSQGESGDRQFWLKAFEGEAHKNNRKGHELSNKIKVQKIIPHLAIGVIGGTQADNLKPFLLRKKAELDDGMAHRFLWMWPNARALPKDPDAFIPVPTDDATATEALAAIEKLEMDHPNRPVRISTTPEADKLLRHYQHRLAHQGSKLSTWRASTLSKAPGLALRLSCVLAHLRWSVDAANPPPAEIDADVMQSAIALMDDYFLIHADRLRQGLMIGDSESDARALIALIIDKKFQTFRGRDIQRYATGRLGDVRNRRTACGILVDAGLLRENFIREGDSKGKPREEYIVNARMFERRSNEEGTTRERGD